ncbi:hypothetical protein Tco_0144877 [Tanacetum coccineum]
MKMCTKLSDRVLALETEKASQALEISSLKKQVKRLEKKVSKRTHKLKRLYKIGTTKRVQSSDDEVLGAKEDASKQVRIHEAMDDEIEATQENDSIMFDTTVLDSEEVVTTVENEVSAAPSIPTVSTDIELCTAPELFDVDSGRIFIVIVNTKEYHSDVLAIITRIMHRTLDNNL